MKISPTKVIVSDPGILIILALARLLVHLLTNDPYGFHRDEPATLDDGAGGVLLSRTRRHLTSVWLWAGVILALLIFLPNLIWQIRYDFISPEFLSSIHARDIKIGRTEGLLLEQFFVRASLFTIPLWVAGLYYYFFSPAGARYRLLGWGVTWPAVRAGAVVGSILILYGPPYGLPEAISGINSYWLRGYGDEPPKTVIIIGFSSDEVRTFFELCYMAGQISNRYGVENKETRFHPYIFVCRELRQPWPALWQRFKHFG